MPEDDVAGEPGESEESEHRDEAEDRGEAEDREEDEDEAEALGEDEFDEGVDARPSEPLPLPVPPIQEPGLSVDPEDLGRQWLATATEQANFESASRPEGEGEEEGMHVTKLPEEKTEEE